MMVALAVIGPCAVGDDDGGGGWSWGGRVGEVSGAPVVVVTSW